ncbi:hypothetical protein RJT17_35135 [Streptomyces sp. P5-A9]|uniref:hypothetical protein n=1 Tax=Streptomyces sp. P5-A9 TaxID=3071730 RepID=UPI002FC9ABBB
MIPAQHRMKGAGFLLGASAPGQAGPYGPYNGENTEPEEDADDERQTPQAAKPAGGN